MNFFTKSVLPDLSETGRFFTLAADKNFGFQMQIYRSKMAENGRFLVKLKIPQKMTVILDKFWQIFQDKIL